MFGTIRKHQTWLWWGIVLIMIAGMATFTQMNKSDNQRGAGNYGQIDGKAITDTEYRDASLEAALIYWLRNQEWPDTGAAKNAWEQQTYQRLFLIRKLEEYNIHADNDAVAGLASRVLRQVGRGQNYPLDAFVAQYLQPHNMTAEDFQRFVEHDVSIQQLIATVGAAGKMVPPEEIKALYIQEHQEVKAQAAIFSASNYLATIPEPTPAMLGQFYTNQESRYREPDRMQVSYVHFNVTNYLAEAKQKLGTNITSEVEDTMRKIGTNALSLGNTEAEQKTKLQELIIRGMALSNAYNAALSFQKELTAKAPARPDNLNTLAREKGLEVKISKPFDKEYGPSDLELPPNQPVADLFNLTTDDPFPYKPMRAENGIYILGYNKFIPSRVPPLDEIRSRVVADFKESEAMRTAQMNARMFEITATNGLARGQTFNEITAGAKVKPLDLPPFSASTETLPELEDEVDMNTLKQAVISTPAGKVTSPIPTRTGGMVVYVRERLPIDETKMQADLPNFSKLVRQARENQAFEMWFEKEFTPLARQHPEFQQQGRS